MRRSSSPRRTSACGSSREHAAWAIHQFGFRAVIAPSFADIFFSNAGKNGLNLVKLSEEDTETLLKRSTANPAHQIKINVEEQIVTDDRVSVRTLRWTPSASTAW